ncbi:hypothetical protein TW95_gp1555 [Pandoravirus inopinatum]|uniref:Uncharacterized protein n=1 Tax=Pandoravirus inopinatum TaxID=1605721 RepID=A0A0B5J3W3_9VIRU|nr:hypothetical protein TW95_gp1555 [Pandoravirus inopinatum]AJF98289.1 hypothetical protein [Pandoravirus inopinatum]
MATRACWRRRQGLFFVFVAPVRFGVRASFVLSGRSVCGCEGGRLFSLTPRTLWRCADDVDFAACVRASTHQPKTPGDGNMPSPPYWQRGGKKRRLDTRTCRKKKEDRQRKTQNNRD